MMICAFFVMAFFGCSHDHDHDDHGHDHAEDTQGQEAEEHVEDEDVHLLQKQMDVMGIELSSFQYLNLSTTVKANGQLELPPQNQASISAILGGRVKGIEVVEGDFIRKGQTLARLEHPDFIEIQEQYMMARSEFEYLEQDYQREKSLLADGIIPEKDFQKTVSEFRASLAEINALKLKLEMLHINPKSVEEGNFISSIPVKSPIKGFVKQIEVNMGKFVEPETEMFEIVDNDHIHIDLMVYEKDLNKIKNKQKVMFSLSSHPDSVFEGSVFAIGRSFEKEPKAMVVHAEIENRRGNLLPGMYVDARIITDKRKTQALPNDAIVADGGLNYVFVLQPDQGSGGHESGTGAHSHGPDGGHDDEYIFRKIEVNTGATDIGFTEVVPAYNLPENVKIVTKGAYYLLAEMKKGEGGHGHHH